MLIKKRDKLLFKIAGTRCIILITIFALLYDRWWMCRAMLLPVVPNAVSIYRYFIIVHAVNKKCGFTRFLHGLWCKYCLTARSGSIFELHANANLYKLLELLFIYRLLASWGLGCNHIWKLYVDLFSDSARKDSDRTLRQSHQLSALAISDDEPTPTPRRMVAEENLG